MKVVNLFGGPGIGKSTLASKIFVELKEKGSKVELASEYAKDLVYEGRHQALENQIYVFGKQLQRLKRLEGKVDIVVCDSPLLLSSIFSPSSLPLSFHTLVVDIFKSFNNYNFVLLRHGAFQDDKSRIHNEEESRQVDIDIVSMLLAYEIPFSVLQPLFIEASEIAELIIS